MLGRARNRGRREFTYHKRGNQVRTQRRRRKRKTRLYHRPKRLRNQPLLNPQSPLTPMSPRVEHHHILFHLLPSLLLVPLLLLPREPKIILRRRHRRFPSRLFLYDSLLLQQAPQLQRRKKEVVSIEREDRLRPSGEVNEGMMFSKLKNERVIEVE